MSNDWLRYASIPAAAVATLALIGAVAPLMSSDAPPYANIARVQKSEKHLVEKIDAAQSRVEAIILRGNLLGAWRACRTALQINDMASVYDYASQISMLQSDYQRVNSGQQYPLPPCP